MNASTRGSAVSTHKHSLILTAMFILFIPFTALAQQVIELLTNADINGSLSGWTITSRIDNTYPKYDSSYSEAHILNNSGLGCSLPATAIMEQTVTIPSVATALSLDVRHWARCDSNDYVEIYVNDNLVQRISSDNSSYQNTTVADVFAYPDVSPGSTVTIRFKAVVNDYSIQTAWITYAHLRATIPPSHSINGTVVDQFGRAASGVTVSYTGDQSGSVTTASNGTYTIPTIYEGNSVTLTPSRSGFASFSPTSRNYTMSTSDITGANFTGTANSYTISGIVLDGGGPGIAGTTLNLVGDRGNSSTTSDSSGNYSFTVYHGDTLTITPVDPAYDFAPASINYTINGSGYSGQTYTGTIKPYTITGTVTDGANPIAGVTLTFSHDSGTTTTAADGSYSYFIPHGASTTITPSHAGYHGWSPASITLSNVTSNQSNQNFQGTINTYTISGTVTDGSNPIVGATLTFSHNSGTATSAADGSYSYTVNYGTSTVVSVSHSAYHGWSPASRTVSSVSNNVSGQDFVGIINTYVISGTVTDGTNPISGATLTFSHNSATTTTAANGTYSYSVPYGTSTTVTASHAGYHGWLPENRPLSNITAEQSGQDFQGTVNTYTISGMVSDGSNPVSGVTLTFSHDSGTATTAANGTYSYSVPYNTTTTITPSHSGYHGWTPATLTLNSISSDQPNQNFQGVINTYTISGTVTDGSLGIDGVILTFSHDSGTTTTAGGGHYSYSVDYGSTTTITPSHAGYHGWTPATLTLNSISSDQPNQNFQGVINTYTISGTVTDGSNPISGATLTFSHDSGTTTTAADGTYSYSVDYGTSTIVTPSHAGYHSWSPASRSLSNIAANQTAQNFQGTPNSYTISGTVTDGSNPIAGVTLTFSHDSGTTTTAGDGTYSYSADYGTTTTITPSHAGYHGWSPATRTLNSITGNESGQDFQGVINTYTISGAVTDGTNPIEGATLTFSHDSGTATTAADGTYSYSVDYGTTTTITASHVGYHGWTPTDRAVNSVSGNVTGRDFEGVPNTYAISGTITDGTSLIAGTTLTFSHDSGSATSAADGTYSYSVDYGVSTTITPTHPAYDFVPANRNITKVTGDSTQDFLATPAMYSVSGTVYEGSQPLSNVTVTLDLVTPSPTPKGKTVKAESQQTVVTDATGHYSFEAIRNSNGTISVSHEAYSAWAPESRSFSAIQNDLTNLDFNGTIKLFTIQADSVEGGLISPSGAVEVRYGDSATFSATADNGYELEYLAIDGGKVPEQTEYTFENVRENHNIKAVFIADAHIPMISYFHTDRSKVGPNDIVVLSWEVSDADTLKIEPGIGEVASEGSIEVVVTESTTYKLTATSSGGSVSATATATIVELPVINWFSSSNGADNPINTSERAMLSWNIDGAESATLTSASDSSANKDVNPIAGEMSVKPNKTSTFVLTATNESGDVTAAVEVGVTDAPRIISFTAAPSKILLGSPTTLSWTTAGNASLEISGIGPVDGPVGSVVVEPSDSTSYTLTALGLRESVQETLGIVVDSAAPELSISFAKGIGENEDTLFTGMVVPVKVDVTNSGDADAKDVYIRLMAGKSVVEEKRIATLKAGKSKSRTFSYLAVEPGTYKLEAVVDSGNCICEYEEDNNADTVSLDFSARPGIDLIIKDVEVNKAGSGAPSGAVSFRFVIANAGTLAARSFQYKAYLDSTGSITPSEDAVLLVLEHKKGLKPGNTAIIEGTAFLPKVWSKVFFHGFIDELNSVSENNESNNLVVKRFLGKDLD